MSVKIWINWSSVVTDPQIAIMMLGLFIFIVMLGFPIAFTLIAMGLGFWVSPSPSL